MGSQGSSVDWSIAKLRKEASSLFESGRFDECLQKLNSLLQRKEGDPKILHNIALVKYLIGGRSNPTKLLSDLNKAKRKSEELACASAAQAGNTGNLGDSFVLGSIGSGTTLHQSPVANSAASVAYADEYDTSVISLNMAVVHYQLQNYTAALFLLEPLFKNIDPIDETTARHICFLLLDVALAFKDASRASCHWECLQRVGIYNSCFCGILYALLQFFACGIGHIKWSIWPSNCELELNHFTKQSKKAVASKHSDHCPTSGHAILTTTFYLIDSRPSWCEKKYVLEVIHYLERTVGIGQLNQEDKGAILLGSLSDQRAPDVLDLDSSGTVTIPGTLLEGGLSDDTAEYDNFILTLYGQNLKKQMPNDLTRNRAIDIKQKLQLYKVLFFLLTGNKRAAKRELKLAKNTLQESDSTTALLLKAQVECARANWEKAIKILANIKECSVSVITNNLGCIYHHLRKHHLASMLFSGALKNSSLCSDEPLQLEKFSQNKSFVTLYNCGLENLFCGRPLVSSQCFHRASKMFYKQPILWLRLAECCLLALEKGDLELNGSSSHCYEVATVGSIGSGRWQQLSLDCNSKNRMIGAKVDDALLRHDGESKLSVASARIYLQTALHLLSGNASEFSKVDNLKVASEDGNKHSDQKTNPTGDKVSNAATAFLPAVVNTASKERRACLSTNSYLDSAAAYNNIVQKENHMIMQVALASLAYVELCLENPLNALSAAKKLQQLPDCSQIFTFLGRVYAAEALCRLNRPKEATKHLSVYISSDDNIDLPYTDESIERWIVEGGRDDVEINVSGTAKTVYKKMHEDLQILEPTESQGLLYVNLAALSAIQGDTEKAIQFVRQAKSLIPKNSRAVLAAIYVDLLLGETQDALVKLKQCGKVRFLPKPESVAFDILLGETQDTLVKSKRCGKVRFLPNPESVALHGSQGG